MCGSAGTTRIAKANNLLVAVDNTFATPYLQQPFKKMSILCLSQHNKIFKRPWYRHRRCPIGERLRKNEWPCKEDLSHSWC